MKAVFSKKGLVSFGIQDDSECLRWSHPFSREEDDRLQALKTFVTDYFYGRDPGTDDIPLDMSGFTEFRTRVYNELMKIPYGNVVTYGELAFISGCPGGARAVGNAMNRNPFLLIVPCHRCVASRNGGGFSLGGFGAGLDIKRFLLRSEGHDEETIRGI
jgi:methylated-DNA-[protein]-cysteine S-methyltransferase